MYYPVHGGDYGDKGGGRGGRGDGDLSDAAIVGLWIYIKSPGQNFLYLPSS